MDTVRNTSVDRLENEEAFIGYLLSPAIWSALSEKGFKNPMRIQNPAMLAIVERHDVIIRAKTGSGKTLAYVMSLLYACSTFLFHPKSAPSILVILPTPALCLAVVEVLATLINLCFPGKYKIGQLTSTTLSEMDLLEGIPNFAVSTPSWLLQNGYLQDKARQESLEVIVLDEVDQLMRDENVLKPLIANLPRYSQCVVVSGDPSSDLRELKTLVRRQPYIVTLTETGILQAGIIPYNVQQFYVSCKTKDKLLHLFSLWVFTDIRATTLIFVNSSETSNKLKSFLEQFGLKVAVVCDGMPMISRRNIVEELKSRPRGLDFIIAVDNFDDKTISSLLGEIDLGDIYRVLIFDMPRTVSGYVRRINHTGKMQSGRCISLVSPQDKKIWRKIKCHMGEDSKFITPLKMPADMLEGKVRPVVEKAMMFGVNCEEDFDQLWLSLYGYRYF